MTPREAAYAEALTRLRAAQVRYEANRDDRASDRAVSDAIRDVLVARADLESIRRDARRSGVELAEVTGGYLGY